MAINVGSSSVGGISSGLLKDVTGNKNKSESALGGASFGDTLSEQIAKAETTASDKISNSSKASSQINGPSKTEAAMTSKPILQFSNHALERMSSRGIHFTPEQITKIEQGMQKASSKGSKEALVLTDENAMIVSLKNNMVVTVMDKNMLKENIFTNIDSTVFV
jgi:flagellar operon protein